MHDYAITRKKEMDGLTVLFIDTKKAKWFRHPWKDLNEYGKRKFENLLVMKNSRQKLKVIYQ